MIGLEPLVVDGASGRHVDATLRRITPSVRPVTSSRTIEKRYSRNLSDMGTVHKRWETLRHVTRLTGVSLS